MSSNQGVRGLARRARFGYRRIITSAAMSSTSGTVHSLGSSGDESTTTGNPSPSKTRTRVRLVNAIKPETNSWTWTKSCAASLPVSLLPSFKNILLSVKRYCL